MASKTNRIAGAGICCLDYIIVSPQPQWGDTALVSDFYTQGGGLVATGLVACARLGADCRLFSLLGTDSVASLIIDELIDEGVSTDGVQKIENGCSPFSFIHVDQHSGERTIFHRPGATLVFDNPKQDLSPIAECGALLVDDVYPSLSTDAAVFAKKHGVPVVADLIPGPQHRELLQNVDVLIAPRHYAKKIGCEDNLYAALEAIHQLGPEIALITLGADGWIYSDQSGRGKGDAFKVDVVDTTGAGDTFHGAFTYGVAQGWETPKSAQFASAVAAIKCTRPGGRTGLPSLSKPWLFSGNGAAKLGSKL